MTTSEKNMNQAESEPKSVDAKKTETDVPDIQQNDLQNDALVDSGDESEQVEETKTFMDSQQVVTFRNVLLGVSIFLICASALYELDIVPAVLLGCGILGLNFHWTMLFVRKLLVIRKLTTLDLIFYLTKFGVSVIVLYVALDHLELSPIGLLIGLSNIAFTAVNYSGIAVIRPQNSP